VVVASGGRHGLNCILMSGERITIRLTVYKVPDPDRPVLTAGNDHWAAGEFAERDRLDC